MKYFFSLWLMPMALATPYIQLSYEIGAPQKEVLLKLKKSYGLKEPFIRSDQESCETPRDYLAMHWCLNKKGELRLLSFHQKNYQIMKKIFKRLK